MEPMLECFNEEGEVLSFVEELRKSTMMLTRDQQKSSANILAYSWSFVTTGLVTLPLCER